MLSGLRFRLTALFLGAGGLFLLAVTAAAYGVVSYFFQRSTDRALQHVMYEHMELLEADIPYELIEAEQAWYSGTSGLLPPQISTSIQPLLERQGRLESVDVEFHESATEQALDAELAAVFVLALSDSGRLLPGFNREAAPLPPDREAVEIAAERGFDWRTISSEGIRVRLLTYRIGGLEEPSYLQVGRSLTDQLRLLGALGVSLLILGISGLLVLGAGAWWLAGRMIRPTELALERQRGFVANASHELRTPLTLIRSSTEVARRHLPPESEVTPLLDDVLQETDHMSQLIEDQLLLSRLDANRLDLTLQPIPVLPMLEELGRKLRRLPAAKSKTIEVGGESAWIRGDPSRLRQVLLILLDNALRHTPHEGKIAMESSLAGDHVMIRVSDSGPGIRADRIDQVFDRFYRVDEARRRGEGGAGLGLAIAQALVAAHSGNIEIASRPGTGTTVIVSMPALKRR
jgi:signal transduction histidine kinase